jgi:hypothetical protein
MVRQNEFLVNLIVIDEAGKLLNEYTKAIVPHHSDSNS